MTASFEFNAPTFIDLNVGLDDSDGADKFFDVESEFPTPDDNKENKPETQSVVDPQKMTEGNVPAINTNLGSSKKEIKYEPQSSSSTSMSGTKPASSRKRWILKPSRRFSTSEGGAYADAAESLRRDLDKLSVKAKKRTHFEGIPISIKDEKQHKMITRNDEVSKTPKLELRTRSVHKVESPAETRKRKSEFGAASSVPSVKYVAMAERILHFQYDTPPRFHSKRRTSGNFHDTKVKNNNRRTIALTPKLLTSLRSRPVDVPSHEEREELELEEMKKHQIKAHPINEKVLQPPKMPRRSERPNTVQEPFNLTEVFKKPAPKPDEKPFQFIAKPVPKVILEKPVGIGTKKQLPLTVPESPAITKPSRIFGKPVKVPSLSIYNEENTEDLNNFGLPYSRRPKNTELKPFSFEERDREMQERKEKRLQEILEAERRAREFKAKPAPSFAAPKETNRPSKHSHLDSSKSSMNSTITDTQPIFKARSPRVLRKQPFTVIKEHIHSQPDDVHLWTEQRARERQEFEMKQQEKSEILAIMKAEREMEKKHKEEEEIQRLRQEAVHKAQPMPNFKPIPALVARPKSAIPLTDPKSPRFTKRTRTNMFCSFSKQ